MLEYSKTILEKVAFDEQLFKKEFEKAMNVLMDHEVSELNSWCLSRFGQDYGILTGEQSSLRVE